MACDMADLFSVIFVTHRHRSADGRMATASNSGFADRLQFAPMSGGAQFQPLMN
jgi:hypothetical protein